MNLIPTGQGSIPRLIPVIDVLGGIVVRAVAGKRDRYRPLVSQLTGSNFPVTVAEALREHAGTAELYLADLDAIMGKAPALPLYQILARRGFQLWVDAGIRTAAAATALVESGVAVPVAGLETLAGPKELT